MYYDPNYIEWGSPTGWRCPGCGRYYAPNQPMCFYCGGNQKTWTSPSTTGMPPNWDDYLKQTTTGKRAFDNYSVTTAKTAEVKTETGQATTTTDKNVVVTAHNSDYTDPCKHSCGKCDKYNKTCFEGIEILPSKAIISHRKPLDIHLS